MTEKKNDNYVDSFNFFYSLCLCDFFVVEEKLENSIIDPFKLFQFILLDFAGKNERTEFQGKKMLLNIDNITYTCPKNVF